MRIHSPVGRIGRPRYELAASPPTLAGLRVAVLDNGKPNARLLLTTVAERVAARTGATLVEVARKGTAATPCEEDVLQHLRGQADLVFTGSAD